MVQLQKFNPDISSAPVTTQLHSAEFYNIRGTEKADKGDLHSALEDFTLAISLKPDEPKFYFNRASVKTDLGDIEGARQDFELASRFSKNIHHFL
ncbi:MAG: hypothetical protein Kow0098_20170 [Ignavibacteriaceae bacterium]